MKFILGLTVLALLFVLGTAFYCYRITYYSPVGDQNDDYKESHSSQMIPLRETIVDMIDTLNAIPYERVTIRSEDGLTLAGRYYHRADGAPLDLCVHGYRGTPARDFSGGTAIYLSEGHNLLMIEQRAHCTSEGHTITFGVKERYDVLAWVRYAISRFGEDTAIFLDGISMGAATVLMTAGLPELPQNVRGVIADCPFTSPKEIICKVSADRGFNVSITYPFLWLGARIFGGFDLHAADALQAARRIRVPVLLIHGEEDRFVPCEMSRRIAAANPEKIRLEMFPGAGHGLSYLIDKPRYTALVMDFTKKALAGEEPPSEDGRMV